MGNECERYTGTMNMWGKTTENKSALDQEINKRKYIMYIQKWLKCPFDYIRKCNNK